MARDIVVFLISKVDRENEKTKQVFAQEESAGQKEFFAAAQTGFKSQCKIKIWQEEYDDQPLVSFEPDGKRYTVYRTYNRDDGKIELYLTDKAGVKYGNKN